MRHLFLLAILAAAMCFTPGTYAQKNEQPVSLPYDIELPQFPGGEAAMYKWIDEHVKWPDGFDEDVFGRVVVSFMVETDGKLTEITVLRELHPRLAEEAVRVVKAMPKWIPGRKKGVPTRMRYNLPVRFRLM